MYSLYIFPTHRAIKEEITKNLSNTILPKYLSIDEFLKRVIIVPNKVYIDEDTRVVLLKEASKQIDIASLGISDDFFSFIKQSSSVLKFFEELSLEKKSIDDIDIVDTYASYEEHLFILKELLDNYIKLLEKNNYVDKITLPSQYKLNLDFLKEFDKIYFTIEGYLSRFEFDMLLEISKIVQTISLVHINQFNPKLSQQFLDIGIKLEENFSYQIDISNKTILNQSNIIQNTTFDIKAFSNRIYQIAFIKAKIYDYYINQQINPSDIVVILPDEAFSYYIDMFDNERYFNFAMGFSFVHTKIYQILDAIYLFFNSNYIKDRVRIDFFDIEKHLKNITKIKPNLEVSKEIFNQIANVAMEYETNNEILKKYKEELYKFNRFLEKIEFSITINQALGLFIKRVAKLSIDDTQGGKITVMGLLETRAIKYKAVIIVDFNEDFIPKRSPKDKFISSNIKHKANLPTPKDRESIQKYFFKRVIQNSDFCAISYTNNALSTPSRYLYELGLELSDDIYDDSYIHILFSTNKKFETTHKQITLNIDLSKQTWSATRLKSYLTCKREYYYKYILKLQNHSISLKPLGFEFGDAVHNALFKVYSKLNNNLDKLTSSMLNQALFEELKDKNNPFLDYERELFKTKFDKFVEVEKKRFQEGYLIFALENEYWAKYNDITIHGKIDRVDINDNMLSILDYKTSSSLKVDTLKTYEKSSDFQLEFYYLLLSKNVKKEIKEVAYYDLNNSKILKEQMLESKLELLYKIFDEIKLSSQKPVKFDMCENKNKCQFCDYKILCKN